MSGALLTFFECTGTTSRSWPGKSVLSSTEILDSGEWRASRVEFDISRHQRHLSSSKGSQKIFEGKSTIRLSVSSAERIACLPRRLQNRYKTLTVEEWKSIASQCVRDWLSCLNCVLCSCRPIFYYIYSKTVIWCFVVIALASVDKPKGVR